MRARVDGAKNVPEQDVRAALAATWASFIRSPPFPRLGQAFAWWRDDGCVEVPYYHNGHLEDDERHPGLGRTGHRRVAQMRRGLKSMSGASR